MWFSKQCNYIATENIGVLSDNFKIHVLETIIFKLLENRIATWIDFVSIGFEGLSEKPLPNFPEAPNPTPPPPTFPSSESHYCWLLNKLYFPWLTSDLALMSMLQTFLSFLVFPAASSCRLAYFSSMSILSCCKKEKPVIPVHYYTMYLTNNYTLCSSLLLWFFFIQIKTPQTECY